MYITSNSVSIPTPWAVAGPHGQLASKVLLSAGMVRCGRPTKCARSSGNLIHFPVTIFKSQLADLQKRGLLRKFNQRVKGS